MATEEMVQRQPSGAFEGVTKNQDFMDKHMFYRFKDKDMPPTHLHRKISTGKSIDSLGSSDPGSGVEKKKKKKKEKKKKEKEKPPNSRRIDAGDSLGSSTPGSISKDKDMPPTQLHRNISTSESVGSLGSSDPGSGVPPNSRRIDTGDSLGSSTPGSIFKDKDTPPTHLHRKISTGESVGSLGSSYPSSGVPPNFRRIDTGDSSGSSIPGSMEGAAGRPGYRRISTEGTIDSMRSSSELERASERRDGMGRMDKYGFLLEDDHTQDGAEAVRDIHADIHQQHERWEAMLGLGSVQKFRPEDDSLDLSYSPKQCNSAFKHHARRGLPDALRRRAWIVLAGIDKKMGENPGEYDQLVKKTDMERLENGEDLSMLRTIERDIRRTFPRHCLFQDEKECNGDDNKQDESLLDGLLPGSVDERAGAEDGDRQTIKGSLAIPNEEGGPAMGRSNSAADRSSGALGPGEGLPALRRVLRAYSARDPEVGYCQGMNFIAATFLTFLSEEESFWMLVATMKDHPYKLRGLFGEGMAGTREVLYIAEMLVAQFLPDLSRRLRDECVQVDMFLMQWLLTVYTSTFPFDLVVRVWDCFLVEGWKVVYRVLLALLESAEKDLTDLKFEEILRYFQDFPSTVNGEAIMAASLKIALKGRHIKRHAKDWRELGDQPELFGSKQKRSLPNLRRQVTAFPQISPPKRLLRKLSREIVVENLTEKLLPIYGTAKFAVLLHNFLTPKECSALIDRAEGGGFEDRSIYDKRTKRQRCNCAVHVLDDESLANDWHERLIQALAGTALEKKLMHAPWAARDDGAAFHIAGVNERSSLLRFYAGGFFHAQCDLGFARPKDGDRAGETSLLSVHVYLNHKFKGGKTIFLEGGRHLNIRPRRGSALLFEHGPLHAIQEVHTGKKYYVRTEIMYSVDTSAELSSRKMKTMPSVAGAC